MNHEMQQLKDQWTAAKAENPKMRIRDLATLLNTSEAQLVALGSTVKKLEGDFREMLKEVHTLGHVMALTRNDDAVHERKGVYNNVSFDGMVGLVLDPDIDLRLFMMHWQFGFAVQEGDRKSLQFFDKSGAAVHKIYLTEKSDETAFNALVDKYTAALQEMALVTETYPEAAAALPDSEIDSAAFGQEWLAMEDTHQFFGLLRKYKLTRTQALRLAPAGYVQDVPAVTVRNILEAAAAGQVPIMAFVANRGCIQIHTGTVTKLLTAGPWFNVMDPEFNLHLREDHISAAYIVKKPSTDGIITSLEVFDEKGDMIIQFFGKRKPGIPELQEWRDVVTAVVPEVTIQ